jgi:hypothetical protein
LLSSIQGFPAKSTPPHDLSRNYTCITAKTAYLPIYFTANTVMMIMMLITIILFISFIKVLEKLKCQLEVSTGVGGTKFKLN